MMLVAGWCKAVGSGPVSRGVGAWGIGPESRRSRLGAPAWSIRWGGLAKWAAQVSGPVGSVSIVAGPMGGGVSSGPRTGLRLLDR
ncbi:hypothetical protein LIER_27093 [Lithospermum erythrorhizon]|uniref:Uncharacterized protein n=1 Tax=Lithospermum erythrorhizon TaxID=34254 RepID=A0AAV3RGN0_LITER